MLIDWFTVGAQALNFIILVWLLKRFLYKPILDAIDAREKRISAELADADAKRAAAATERDALQSKSDAFDHERAALLSQAVEEAKAERQRLLGQARRAAEDLSVKAREALRTEALNLGDGVRARTQREVFAIARKALTDLATTSLEAQICDIFIQRLREMQGAAKARLAEALEAPPRCALVRSAFDLPAPQRAELQRALDEAFSTDIRVSFVTVPELVAGIELSAQGQKLAWSIASYLASLEQVVAGLLHETDGLEVRGQPENVEAHAPVASEL